MKKKDFTLAVKRFANLWYCYDPFELKEKLAQWVNMVLTLNDGIFEKDSIKRDDFIRFTSQLPQLVDATYLTNLDAGGKGIKKKELIKTTKLGPKQLKYPMLYVCEFFQIFPIKFVRFELGLWLDGLIAKEIQSSHRLEKNEIFPFFLYLNEFIEVSHLMLKHLMSLEKENEKEKKED